MIVNKFSHFRKLLPLSIILFYIIIIVPELITDPYNPGIINEIDFF